FGLQLGIAACMTIGNFQSAALIWVIPFLPAWFWDRVLPRRLREAEPAPLSTSTSTSTATSTSTSTRSRVTPLVQLFAGGLGVYVLLCNVGSLFVDKALPGRPERLAYLLGIDQRWTMFIDPRRPTGWTVIPAKLEDGRDVDLLTGLPLRWEKPQLAAEIYGGWRWRVFVTDYIWYHQGSNRPAAYASYLCRSWNDVSAEGARAVSLDIVWMRQTPEDDFTLSEPTRVVVHSGDCPL
ncbi:MAG: hypothetical protein ABI193_17870, partial [Minicystis sp.]